MLHILEHSVDSEEEPQALITDYNVNECLSSYSAISLQMLGLATMLHLLIRC